MNTYSKSAELASSVPSVHIATNNNRRKRYNSDSKLPIYYLNHNDEFQIELYNPTRDVVRCDISLNGKKLQGGGLVLKPGQRVFLDRYLDSTNKFLFETYEVGNTTTDKKAIEHNGSIKVEFYKEQDPNNYTYISGNTIHTTNYCDSSGISNLSFGSTSPSGNNTTFTTTGMTNISYTNTTLLTDSPDPIRQTNYPTSKKTETGRIGKGDVSNQKFTNVHYDFYYFPFYTVEYKLLPHSQKVATVNTVNSARYCTQCGTKLKSSFKFCSNCGTKA